MKIRTALWIAVASFALAGPALAHHSRTMFDQNASRVLHGTIVEFRFINPHSFIIMDVENEDGSRTTWQLEGGNTMGLIRDGLRLDSLRPGDVIDVKINPLLSGAPGGSWNLGDVRLFENGSDTGIRPLDRKD